MFPTRRKPRKWIGASLMEMEAVEQKLWHVDRGSAELEWMLDYELCLALRHQRNVSLVLVSEPAGKLKLGVLGNIIRRADEIFLLRCDAAILMSETPKAGALKAVERLRGACVGHCDLRFAVASYPSDGRLTCLLLNVAHRRLKRACESHRGAVVFTD